MEPTFENLDRLNADIAKLNSKWAKMQSEITEWTTMEFNYAEKLKFSLSNLVGMRNVMEHLLVEIDSQGFLNRKFKRPTLV